MGVGLGVVVEVAGLVCVAAGVLCVVGLLCCGVWWRAKTDSAVSARMSVAAAAIMMAGRLLRFVFVSTGVVVSMVCPSTVSNSDQVLASS